MNLCGNFCVAVVCLYTTPTAVTFDYHTPTSIRVIASLVASTVVGVTAGIINKYLLIQLYESIKNQNYFWLYYPMYYCKVLFFVDIVVTPQLKLVNKIHHYLMHFDPVYYSSTLTVVICFLSFHLSCNKILALVETGLPESAHWYDIRNSLRINFFSKNATWRHQVFWFLSGWLYFYYGKELYRLHDTLDRVYGAQQRQLEVKQRNAQYQEVARQCFAGELKARDARVPGIVENMLGYYGDHYDGELE